MTKSIIPVALVALCMSFAARARAAEIQLRDEVSVRGPILRLGDLAQILSAAQAEAKMLAAIEVGPAPARGATRYIKAQEVRDILREHGVDLFRHKVSGPARVTIRHGLPSLRAQRGSRITRAQRRKAANVIRRALMRYLQEYAEDAATWTVEFKLTPDQIRTVNLAIGELMVSSDQEDKGGQPLDATLARDGQQSFLVQFATIDRDIALRLETDIRPRLRSS